MSRALRRPPLPRAPLAALALGALALGGPLALGGCARTGDLGRREGGVVLDALLPAAGALAAGARGEAVSASPLTDDEREFRDRAWRFLMPLRERSFFDAALGELRVSRALPRDLGPAPDDYRADLADRSGPSPAPRYRRLRGDVDADRLLLGPLNLLLRRLRAADDARLSALGRVGRLTPAEAEDARARVAENEGLARWIADAASARACAYRTALEHLVIETPDALAVPAERSLLALEAETGGGCPGAAALAPRAPRALPAPERWAPSSPPPATEDEDRPLVRKG